MLRESPPQQKRQKNFTKLRAGEAILSPSRSAAERHAATIKTLIILHSLYIFVYSQWQTLAPRAITYHARQPFFFYRGKSEIAIHVVTTFLLSKCSQKWPQHALSGSRLLLSIFKATKSQGSNILLFYKKLQDAH